ncbi:hypothetical protein ACNS7O_04735 [Haloferacaceae archaeon DSL9]
MTNNTTRTLVTRTVEGVEALVSTEPNELFLDIPASSPRYIHVRVGDVVREGDVRSRQGRELESPTLSKWRIEEIGPETVVGTDLDDGDRTEWNREKLETQLAIGTNSVDLSSFERVSIARSEGWGDSGPHSEPHLTVVVYGNDGRTFHRTYGVDDETRQPEQWYQDHIVDEFDSAVRERFEEAIELALRNDGYTV